MSQNYINLGTTCSAFGEVFPSAPQSYGQGTVFYILNGTTATAKPVKYTEPMINTVASTSNSITLSDYQFNLWWDANVIRSGVQRTNWRVITKAGAASDNVDGVNYDSNKAVYSSNIISTASWPVDVQSFPVGQQVQINYSADNTNDAGYMGQITTLQLTTSTSTLITNPSSNVFLNLITVPGTGTTPLETTNFTSIGNPFYLRKTGESDGTSGGNYLAFLPLNTMPLTSLGNFDMSNSPYNPQTDKSYLSFKVFLNRSESGKLYICLCHVSADADTPPNNLGTIKYNPDASPSVDKWIFTYGGVDYYLTQTPPTSPASEVGFPNSITMFKFGNKYLYWNGSSGTVTTGAFSLKDYWTSGLSTSNIYQGMQFFMGDVLRLDQGLGQTGQTDIYRWHVLTNTPESSSTTANYSNTSNVIANPDSTVIVSTDQYNSPGDGWVLQSQTAGTAGTPLSADTKYALVFSNTYSGSYNPVVYANVLTSDQTSVSFINTGLTLGSWSSIPTHAYSWTCVKCTANDVSQSACAPQKSLGSSISITRISGTSIYISVTGSSLSSSDTVSFELRDPLNTPVSLSTSMPVTFSTSMVINASVAPGIGTYTVLMTSSAASGTLSALYNISPPQTTIPGNVIYSSATRTYTYEYGSTGTLQLTGGTMPLNISITIIGGGGGGGAGASLNHSSGGGGGGGGYIITQTLSLPAPGGTNTATYNITIGNGGNGGTVDRSLTVSSMSTPGNQGGASSFSGPGITTIQANGGGGGGRGALISMSPTGGRGGTSTNNGGNISTIGSGSGGGGGGFSSAGANGGTSGGGIGGNGNSSGYGSGGGGGGRNVYPSGATGGYPSAGGAATGGSGAAAGAAGTNGTAYGCGGGGGGGSSSNSTYGFPGGNGFPGAVIITLL